MWMWNDRRAFIYPCSGCCSCFCCCSARLFEGLRCSLLVHWYLTDVTGYHLGFIYFWEPSVGWMQIFILDDERTQMKMWIEKFSIHRKFLHKTWQIWADGVYFSLSREFSAHFLSILIFFLLSSVTIFRNNFTRFFFYV